MSDALGTEGERGRRHAALALAHMRPLAAFVERLRARHPEREIPHADPADGGVEARVLLLLEAPGPQSVRTGFVSRDSPNGTARNLRALLEESGVPRQAVLLWNVVPWYVGDGRRIRPVTKGDAREASGALDELLELLPRLERVVLLGRKAQSVERRLRQRHPSLPMVHAWHPSPQVFNISPTRKAETRAVFAALGSALVGERDAR